MKNVFLDFFGKRFFFVIFMLIYFAWNKNYIKTLFCSSLNCIFVLARVVSIYVTNCHLNFNEIRLDFENFLQLFIFNSEKAFLWEMRTLTYFLLLAASFTHVGFSYWDFYSIFFDLGEFNFKAAYLNAGA